MNAVARFIIRYFFKIVYTLGLVFIIFFLSTTKAPSELGLWKGTPAALAGIASILVIVGVIGVYLTCQRSWARSLRSLGLWTLIPGIIALLTSVYGANLVYSLVEKTTRLEITQPIIDAYMDRRVPKVWTLTVAYIFIGLFLYITGVRKQFFG